MSLLSQNLQAFLAIVQQTTVHGAAKQLNLTQTAITQRIRTLESGLGTTLFLRSRKGMKLTSEGEALLRYCNGAKDLEGQVLSQITGSKHNQPIQVSVAGPTSVMTARIVDLCSGLYDQFPQLYLNFIINDDENRLNLLRSGKADMAIISPHLVPDEMDSKILKSDKYILVASSKWKGRKLTDILENERVIDFDESDSTTMNYLKKFDLHIKLSKTRLFANNNSAIIKLFSQGVGFGTLTQEIAKPFLDAGELISLNAGALMEDPLALVWYPRPEMPNYFRALVAALK